MGIFQKRKFRNFVKFADAFKVNDKATWVSLYVMTYISGVNFVCFLGQVGCYENDNASGLRTLRM